MPSEYLTLGEAADVLKISRSTLWRRIQEDGLQTYQSAQDKRVRLVRRDDVEDMMKPRPIIHTPVDDMEGKAAA